MLPNLYKQIEIAVIAPTVPEEFFDLLWKGVWSAAFELASFGVTVQTFKTDKHDAAAQLAILTDLLGSRFGAIALVPAHPQELKAAIAEHCNQARPVITFHSDAAHSGRCSFVGTSAPEAGALAAEALAKFMGFRGKVATFPGDLGFEQFAQRYQGFHRELGRYGGGLKEAFCHIGLDGLPEALERALAEHPDLGGIYVGCARAHLIAAALKKSGLRIPFVGFDNTPAVTPYLQDGTIWAVIDESVHQQGYIAVQRAYEMCVNKAADHSQWVRVPSSLVLASNSSGARVGQSLNEAFEQLIRQQTAQLSSYQEMLEAANQELQRLAETDALTGLLNRRKLEEILPLELHRAHRGGRASLLMMDVDHFKQCNDNFGHHVGDEALRTVAHALRSHARESDFCARWGGDEFCVLLPGAGPAEAERLRNRICDALSATSVLPGGAPMQLRMSIGIAHFPEDGSTPDELVIAADRAMYHDKRAAQRAREPVAS